MSMLYENSIELYLTRYQTLAKKLDTVHKNFNIQGTKLGGFKGVNINFDKIPFKNRDFIFLKNFGTRYNKDSVETESTKHIGTIGADLFQEKYLIIDFLNNRMASIDSLNNFYQKNTVFVNVKLDKGRIKVPIQVNGKTYYFMFDTGSSMFPLITAKKDISVFNKQGEVKESVKTSSWGTKYNVSGYTIDMMY